MTTMEAAKAAQLSSIMNDMAQLDDTSRRETLLNSLCNEDVLELPEHESPPSVESGFLNADLLKHQVRVSSFNVRCLIDDCLQQKQALLWCIEAENPVLPTTVDDKPVQFWKLEKAGNKVCSNERRVISPLILICRTITITVSLKFCLMGISLIAVTVATKTPQERKPVLGRGGILGMLFSPYLLSNSLRIRRG